MSNRASAAMRLSAWAVAIGLLAAVLQALVAVFISGAIARVASLASTELGQAAIGLAVLSALASCAALALSALAGLGAELPAMVGAAGGAIAALAPAVVIALGEGLDALGPLTLALVRGAGLLACIAAGAAGVGLGRRLARL